jgi:hypothetical protein
MPYSIADSVWVCLKAFRAVQTVLHLVDQPTPFRNIRDQEARFRLWAGNIGAHRKGKQSSLDYRLREASHLRNAVQGLVDDLVISLNDGMQYPGARVSCLRLI